MSKLTIRYIGESKQRIGMGAITLVKQWALCDGNRVIVTDDSKTALEEIKNNIESLRG